MSRTPQPRSRPTTPLFSVPQQKQDEVLVVVSELNCIVTQYMKKFEAGLCKIDAMAAHVRTVQLRLETLAPLASGAVPWVHYEQREFLRTTELNCMNAKLDLMMTTLGLLQADPPPPPPLADLRCDEALDDDLDDIFQHIDPEEIDDLLTTDEAVNMFEQA